MKITSVALLVLVSCGLWSCGQAGFSGYYQAYPKVTKNRYIADSVINSTKVSMGTEELWFELPRDNSSFRFVGIVTPITPPIPIFWLKSWNSSDFSVMVKPDANVILKSNNRILTPEVLQVKHGYTKYKFPIRSKDIDKGTLIIEKNGKKIEVPFEYQYFKFWY